MRKLLALVFSIVSFGVVFAAGDCSNIKFNNIKAKAIQMEKAWDSANLKGVVSFYDDDFIYMSGGKTYTNKQKVLKHYVDSFATASDDKKDIGRLRLNYQYCRELNQNQQLVIMEFVWTSPQGKTEKGHDLLVWQKDKKEDYKIIVDFPQ
ncbi:nuclear transport factor 2 family protein [Francisellaceae bacterium CB299]|jgi:hypothetical protein